jgi:hypothetical protein
MTHQPNFEALKEERATFVESVVARPTTDAWVRISQILLESPPCREDEPLPTVYEGPARSYLLPLPYQILSAFIKRHGTNALDLLFQHCDDASPLLAAYCIFGLAHAEDSRLERAAQKVNGRNETLATLYGCFGWEGTLSEYAAEKLQEFNNAKST